MLALTINLDDCLVHEIYKFAKKMTHEIYINKDFDELVNQNKIFLNFISKIKSHIQKYNVKALCIKNLPIDDDLPDTPKEEDYKIQYKKTFVSEACLIIFSKIFGDIVSYKEEKKGLRIHNIYPLPQYENSSCNHSSANDFELHNEIAFDYNRPDYIGLIGLRKYENTQVMTGLVDFEEFFFSLPLDDQEKLFKISLNMKKPESFYSNNDDLYKKVFIVEKYFNSLRSSLNFNPGMMQTNTEDDYKYINEIYHKLKDKIEFFDIAPGTLIIFNNKTTLHCRQKFKSNHCGNDRWIQRVYMSESCHHVS